MEIDDGVTLATAIEDSFSHKRYSDLVIKCGDRSWEVHKLIVCRCPFFEKACAGPFKEAKEGVITLHDDDPGAVESMLFYLYTENLGCRKVKLPMVRMVQLVTLADKYGVDGLKQFAENKYSDWAENKDFQTSGFLEACHELYSAPANGCHDELRDITLETILSTHMPKSGDTVPAQLYDIITLPELGVDLLLRSTQKLRSLEASRRTSDFYKCNPCGRLLYVPDIKQVKAHQTNCLYCGKYQSLDLLITRRCEG